MPLQPGHSKRVIAQNIQELIAAGHNPAQSVAIAHKESNDNTVMEPVSNRQVDCNGWYEIVGNPISKIGVFPYSGAQLMDSENSQGLDPNRIYMVYRPPEELGDPGCLNSFRLLPWVIDHTNLGPTCEGLTPAEQKGVQGVIGENVYFDGEYLRANIKVFSEYMANLIAIGKKELSIGYKALYEFTAGDYNGVKYDAIQRHIRGNHLATVEEGRCGPTVAVLDHMKLTLDAKEFKAMAEENKDGGGAGGGEMSVAEMLSQLQAIVPAFQQMQAFISKLKPLEEAEHPELQGDKGATDDAGAVPPKPAEASPAAKAAEPPAKPAIAVGDSAEFKALKQQVESLKKDAIKAVMGEIAQRDKLASDVSHLVGTFDSATMTMQEVGKYAAKKLEIACADGAEVTAVEAYLQGIRASRKPAPVATGDSAEKGENAISKFLKGGE